MSIPDANKEICWVHCGPYPVEVGFTMSAKALRKHFKEIGSPIEKGDEACSSNGFSGSAIVRFCKPEGKLDTHCICYLPKSTKGTDEVQVAALLAHEVLHIVQRVWLLINEDCRLEAEAYLLQYIFQIFYFHYRLAVGIDKS